MAEAALGSLVRKYENAPETHAITRFFQSITTLLSSLNNCVRGGAACAIWLIERHNNAHFSKAFWTAGVARPLAMLFSSSN